MRKTLFLLRMFVIFFAVSAHAASNFEGEFTKHNAGIKFEAKGEKRFFRIYSFVGVDTCEVQGELLLINDTRAGYTGEQCAIVFVLEENKTQIKIGSVGCKKICVGKAIGSIDGEYKKKP